MKTAHGMLAFLASWGILACPCSLLAQQPSPPVGAARSQIADVRAHGAVGDGSADDTAAIQAAITSLRTSGGQVWLPPGTYRLTRALVISMATPTTSLWIQGSGNGATKLVQSTATADVFEIGATGANVADQISLADLWLVGGRYGLNLNNALVGTFDRLLIQNAQIGIYLQGQNERHTFRNIQIDGSAFHGIYAGAENGGAGKVLDLPELQKTSFDTVRVSGTLGGTAIVIGAGRLGNQQSSGVNVLRRILLESNKRGSLQIDYAFNTVVEGMTTEEQLDADNVYSSVLVGHQSSVTLRDLFIGKSSGRSNFAYYVNINSGNVTIEDSVVSGGAPAGTADIRVNDSLTLINSMISRASAVQFTGDVQRQTSVAIAVRDTSGRLLTWSGLGLTLEPARTEAPAGR
jgi:pectate lyase-like protein